MPSAASVKVDKQITSESSLVDANNSQHQNTPIRQALVIIEHKIRNLEKRKAKLESYKDLQSSGKELNADQKVAVAKFDEVVQTLEFARDLCKQFHGIATVAEKDAKKQARKEAAAKSQQELAKIREVLLVQDALAQLGNESVREDFLVGRNGAANLSEEDLKLMDDLYMEVVPRHEPGAPAEFTSQVQTAAEHLLAVVDGKQKDVFTSNYAHIKEVIGKVHESGYFDQPPVANNVVEYTEEITEIAQIEPQLEAVQLESGNVVNEIPIQSPIPVYMNVQEALPQEEIPIVPPPQPQVIEQQPQPPQQFFQQPRPISEVLGTPQFLFLQDSELDSPEQIPQNPVIPNQAIPSQTFTNQNFVNLNDSVPRQNQMPGFGPPNPPPPIPMPPSHLGPMAPTQNMADFVVPMQAYGYQQSPVQEEKVHQPNETTNRNADDVREPTKTNENDGSPRNGPRNTRPNNNHQKRNGPPPSQGQGGYHQHQNYYQNNGYSNNSNRQRSNRGGQRQGGDRKPMHHSQNKMKPTQH